MRYLAQSLLIICGCLSGLSLADTDGAALAQKIFDRPDGDDAASKAVMILAKKGSKPRYRTMYTYRLDTEDGDTLSLTRFTEPPEISGTGLLNHDRPGDENSQWIYLPALDRARRISTSRKGGRFVGSDIYYEDMSKRDASKDRHRILGEGKVGSTPTTMLESIPLDTDDSVYSKRISWVHLDTLIPLQVDYYMDETNSPVKRMKVSKIQKQQGYWTVLDSTISDLESGHQTRVVTQAIEYNQALPVSLFSRQSLSDIRLAKDYRP